MSSALRGDEAQTSVGAHERKSLGNGHSQNKMSCVAKGNQMISMKSA